MRLRYSVVGLQIVVLVSAAGCARGRREVEAAFRAATDAGRPPRLRPDYTECVVPPNIAPLNFAVREPGVRYCVRVHGGEGAEIAIVSRASSIVIPQRPWRRLLEACRGQPLHLDVCVQSADSRWVRYKTVSNRVAQDEIDRYLVCRVIAPAYNYWGDIAIRERDLEGYCERTVLHNRLLAQSCINCHSFRSNHTDRMTIGIRGEAYGSGTALSRDGSATKVATKFGYTAWHPSGRLLVYADAQVRQFFHAARAEVRDVIDLDSNLAYYDLRANAVETTSAISDSERLETYPTWSPDGRYLYFCSAPILWETPPRNVPPERYQECRYDLLRISFDLATDQWGKPRTLLSAKDTGQSILLPRVSPDGRFLLFSMCDYGCFPIYQPSSDLYMMDLESGEYWELDINSGRSESWHSWSSNGRWIAFSSKRDDGLFTRTYLSHVDANGRAEKPFIVPQKDPLFYDSFLKTYTVPELVLEPVQPGLREVAEAVRWPEPIRPTEVGFDQPKAPTPTPADAQWQSTYGVQ